MDQKTNTIIRGKLLYENIDLATSTLQYVLAFTFNLILVNAGKANREIINSKME